MNFPDELLLVSQQTKISNEGLYDKYKEKIPGLFCNYSVRPLYEKDSNIFFTYNNYPRIIQQERYVCLSNEERECQPMLSFSHISWMS